MKRDEVRDCDRRLSFRSSLFTEGQKRGAQGKSKRGVGVNADGDGGHALESRGKTRQQWISFTDVTR